MGSSTMSAAMPRSRSCSATTKRNSALVMTIGRANRSGSEMRASTCWKVDSGPTRETNCFGMLSRETGHRRVPAPPHMITGTIRAGIRGSLDSRDSSSRPGAKRQAILVVRFRSSSARHARAGRSKPPKLDAGRFRQRIERALDVHDDAVAVLEQARDERPPRFPIGVMGHRQDDGVGGRGIALQDEAVFLERRRRIGKRIVNLHCEAAGLELANDVDRARTADIDDILL